MIAWTRPNDSEVLAVAGGGFLLNLPLTEPARWPLAERTVAWTDGRVDADAAHDPHQPRNVAFVEGSSVMLGTVAEPSVFVLLKVSPFGQVAAQLLRARAGGLPRPGPQARPPPARGGIGRRPARRPPRGPWCAAGAIRPGARGQNDPRSLSTLAQRTPRPGHDVIVERLTIPSPPLRRGGRGGALGVSEPKKATPPAPPS